MSACATQGGHNKAVYFSGKQYNFDQVNEFCISQGSADCGEW